MSTPESRRGENGHASRAAWQRELLRRYHDDGDLSARAALGEQLVPLARSLAARYVNQHEPHDDLVQVACVGLMKAIDGFDPSRNTAFSSFATPTILGEIKRHFRDRTWAIRPPRGLQELLMRVARTRDELTSDLGRGPSIEELAVAVDASQEDVLAAIEAGSARRARSISESIGEDTTLGDSLGAVDPGLPRAEIRAVLGGAMGVLAEREREILRLRFEQDLTQQQIADIVGVSQMQVSRLMRQSLARLRMAIGDDPSTALAAGRASVARAA